MILTVFAWVVVVLFVVTLLVSSVVSVGLGLALCMYGFVGLFTWSVIRVIASVVK